MAHGFLIKILPHGTVTRRRTAGTSARGTAGGTAPNSLQESILAADHLSAGTARRRVKTSDNVRIIPLFHHTNFLLLSAEESENKKDDADNHNADTDKYPKENTPRSIVLIHAPSIPCISPHLHYSNMETTPEAARMYRSVSISSETFSRSSNNLPVLSSFRT